MFNNFNIKIISGGQTGVDRAALDFALENNINCGGWCPKDRIAEDGIIPRRYPLIETDSDNYNIRTRKNVLEADGTLIFHLTQQDDGTKTTKKLCDKYFKPTLQVKLTENLDFNTINTWVKQNNIRILNIAGPRESNDPGVYSATLKFLKNFLEQA